MPRKKSHNQNGVVGMLTANPKIPGSNPG
jgi:hypothetical protein